MRNVLIVNSSPTPDDSVSTSLTSFFHRELLAAKGFEIVTRDLGTSPPSHLNSLALSGFFIDPCELNETQQNALRESDALIKELVNAEIIIIGAAMHNHTVTSGLKSYIDQVTRPGLTFKYEADGPRGFLTNKKVFIITSAGGDYSSGNSKNSDYVTPLLKEVLGFIGLDEIKFIPVFNTYSSNEICERNKNSARETIKIEVQRLKGQ